jgi:hypothetical protein
MSYEAVHDENRCPGDEPAHCEAKGIRLIGYTSHVSRGPDCQVSPSVIIRIGGGSSVLWMSCVCMRTERLEHFNEK